MGYTVVQDFKAGVDRRRPIFAGEPGSLWEAINGHLTRGGDFEKRKAFVNKFDLTSLNTFGLAATETALYTFGSVVAPPLPAGLSYQRLQHPDGFDMTAVLGTELFDGFLYVIARFSDDSIVHFYNGEVVQDWITGKVRASMSDLAGVAAHLAALIDADPAYIATSLGSVITITAAVAGTPYDLTTTAENVAGGTNDQTAVVALVDPNVPAVAETLASVYFDVTAGTANPGVNRLVSITIGGVTVTGGAVDWITSNAVTAANIAADINSAVSAPDYIATASGQRVTITGAVGSGATPNGLSVVLTTGGDMRLDGAAGTTVNKNIGTTTAGVVGVNAVAGQAQVQTVTLGGTFDVGDRYTVIIDEKNFGADGNPRNPGTFAHTQVNKVWSPAGSILNFSGVANPTGWNVDTDAGAGNLNAATHAGGSSTVTGLESYQGKLAIFSKRSVQIWTVDEDEELNAIAQTLKNTGTSSPNSVIAFSDMDVVFLDRYGIRSLRARDSSNAAQVSGVGALIDKYIVPYKRTLTAAQIAAAVSAIDPEDGRLWMALGNKIFVFSYFPETKISGWSWYEPGFSPEWMVDYEDRMYVRAGDIVYLYGGDDNETYDDALVTCWLPFVSVMKKDGTYVHITGVDIAAENQWHIDILLDPNDVARVSEAGTLEGCTFHLEDTPVIGRPTHLSPKLTCAAEGYAVLSKIGVFYDGAGESGHG